jgi:hypothetical protein
VEQGSSGVTQILDERFEQTDATGFTALVFDLIESAKFQASATNCLRFRYSRFHIPGDLLREVEAQLLVQFTLGSTAPEQRPQPEKQVVHQDDTSYAVSRIWLTTAVSFSQAARSISSWRRPVLVSS